MMRHDKIERLIQKSLDHETNVEEDQTLHSHLSRCHACQQLYKELALTDEMLAELIEVFPRPGFNDRVLRKIGIRRALVWTRAAAVFAGIWLGSLLLIAFSPWPNELFSKTLTSIPSLMGLFDKVQVTISAFSHALIPFAKISLNSLSPFLGLIFSILLFYIFGKALKKEATCKL